MSAIKRYIEDKCEEIAKATGLEYGKVMDIFNELNERFVGGGVTADELWAGVEWRAKKEASDSAIKTGYIPVEYNQYKELVEKAKKYDALVKF